MDITKIPFVGSPHFTPGTPDRRRYDYVVIHDMEYPERNDAAENVANYFRTTDRQVSAHFCVDADSIVQCVKLTDVAWTAPGCNSNGIQIELAGYARQSAAEWQDIYSAAMLDRAAQLAAALCNKYRIPIGFIPSAGILAGRRGITTHAQVTLAFPEKGTGHTDPGPGFPILGFTSLVDRYATAGGSTSAKPWPIPVPAWFWEWARWHLGGRKGAMPDAVQKVVAQDGRIPQWAWLRLNALIDARKEIR